MKITAVYQYLFKRNNEAIPYKLYDNPVVNTAIKNRIAYLGSKADTLFSLSVYYVVLYQGLQATHKLGSAFAELPKNPKKALADLHAHFSSQKQVVALARGMSDAEAALLQKARSFILQVSDFLPVRMLDKQEAFRVLKRTLNFRPDKLELAKLKYDTFLDYYLPESPIECHRGHLRVDDYYVKVLTLKEPSAQSFPLIFKRLLEVEANYYVVTEWKKEDSGKMRRTIQTKRRHFHNTKRSFASQVSLNDAPTQDVLLDDSKESQVRELGEGIKEIELHGNYFGQFSLTVVIYDLDMAKVDRACADFYKVFSVHDAQLYEENYNLLNAFLAAVPGNHVFNLRSLYLLNTNYADFSFLFTLHSGQPRNQHLRHEYLAVLETNHHTPYYLNLHYRDVAHTMILGRTGAGKSFLLNFLITNLQKYDPHTFIFDLGGSFESLTQLFGGSYVRVGLESEGFKINPFSLPPTKENLDFLALFLKVLIQGTKPGELDPATERDLFHQVENLYAVDPFTAHAGRAGKHARARHCEPAFQMDSRRTVWIPFRQCRRHHFLFPLPMLRLPAHEPVPGTPGTAALLHPASRQCRYRGPPDQFVFKAFFIDEAWVFLKNPAIQRYVVEALKTWRKHNAAMVLVHAIARRTQALRHPRRHHRKLRHQNLPRESRYGQGTVPSAVPPERKRSRAHFRPYPEAAILDQDAGAREGREPQRRSQELLAVHQRSLRQQETKRGVRHIRFREGSRNPRRRRAVILVFRLLELGRKVSRRRTRDCFAVAGHSLPPF